MFKGFSGRFWGFMGVLKGVWGFLILQSVVKLLWRLWWDCCGCSEVL